jgi:hypothetical protein
MLERSQIQSLAVVNPDTTGVEAVAKDVLIDYACIDLMLSEAS